MNRVSFGQYPQAWYSLRASRSDPSFIDSRRVYQASLQQAEELWVAARAAGPAGRPLPLFYFLAQAGRAITVARGGTPAKAHGLTIGRPVVDDILKCTVEPGSRGWFQSVADATGSPGLHRPTELGALLASLPGFADHMPKGAPWPVALPVWTSALGTTWTESAGPDFVPGVVVFRGNPPSTVDALRAALAPYPDTSGVHPDQLGGPPVEDTSDGRGVVINWPRSAQVGPEFGPDGRWWLRPALHGTDAPPSCLMTWWAALFTLSMLARYHPVEWASALDPDRSPVAVLLERTMETALEVVPQLVLEAVSGAADHQEKRPSGGASSLP